MNTFDAEFEKLQTLLSQTNFMDLSYIVQVYHQVISVSSLCQMLDLSDIDKDLLEKISEAKNFIHENFDSKIHPQILKSLTDSIEQSTRTLQSEKSQTNSDMYEDLRKKMSTKEFVEQYQASLS